MTKKRITIDGKQFEEVKDDGKPEEKEEVATEEEPKEEKADDLEEKADEVAQKIVASLGLDKLTEKVNDIHKKFEEKYASSKVSKIFNAKDLKKSDVADLTVEEKIVSFFQAAVQNNQTVLKALSEGTAADGGYLFPDEFRAEIIRNIESKPYMRGEVRVVPMKRDVMKIPTLVSSVQVSWTDENATKSTTTAHFYEATLTVKKMAAILYASDELIEDSDEIDVVRLIIDLFAEKIGQEEDRVITAGNGTTQPTGLQTAVAATTIPNVTCSGNLSFDNMINLEYALPSQYHPNAKFYAHRNNIRELRKLKDTNSRYYWEEPVSKGQPATFHGYPVIENNWLPEATILFGDLKQTYWLGDRKKMTVKVTQDTETAFTKDQTAIRVVERIAGNVVLGNASRALVSIP